MMYFSRETRGFAQALCAENDIKARASFMFHTDPTMLMC